MTQSSNDAPLSHKLPTLYILTNPIHCNNLRHMVINDKNNVEQPIKSYGLTIAIEHCDHCGKQLKIRGDWEPLEREDVQVLIELQRL